MSIYNEQFYTYQINGATESAKQVVPLIVKMYGPKSVIDVGGGAGAWCAQFDAMDINAVCLDGDYVPKNMRVNKHFLEHNLLTKLPNDKRYDLALCLEVAEHLPAERAETFVKELTALADVIVFSAAIPGQGGTNHINEQPHEYWHNLFAECGYKKEDVLRLGVAGMDRVEWWYKQNIFTYKKQK